MKLLILRKIPRRLKLFALKAVYKIIGTQSIHFFSNKVGYLRTMLFVSIVYAAKCPSEPLLMLVVGLAGESEVGARSDIRMSFRVL
jgi:hypothetical protein